MWLLLSSLAVLFASAVLVVIVIRLQAQQWPDSLPPLPATLWMSTGLLLASGFCMEWGRYAIQRGRARRCTIALACTFVLAVGFLVLQTVAWFQWTSSIEEAEVLQSTHQIANSTFLILTGLHAAHIIGGLVPLGLILWYALLRSYSANVHVVIRDTAMYWYFLDVVWILLVVFMLIVL